MLFLLLTCFAGRSQNTKPGVGQLHDSIHVFLHRYFPENQVDHYKLERDGLAVTAFDIYLDDGSEIVFNRDGEWTEIDMDKKPVPNPLIPPAILQYVRTEYPKADIIEIEKEEKNIYKIVLDNDVDFLINESGQLIHTDD